MCQRISTVLQITLDMPAENVRMDAVYDHICRGGLWSCLRHYHRHNIFLFNDNNQAKDASVVNGTFVLQPFLF